MNRRSFPPVLASCLLSALLGLWGLPAQAAESIAVGRSLPLSGPLKSYGEAKRDGGDAYIDKINKAGGIGGRTITLQTLDDEYQPAKAVANLKALAQQHQPTAFLGLFGVPAVAAALPVLLELKIPAVGLTSGTQAVRKPHNPYAFPVRASYEDESRKLVAHVKSMGVTRISVIYTDNPFGITVRDTLLEALTKDGLTAKTFKLDPAGATAAEVVKQVAASESQSVFLTMLSQAAIPAIRELKKSTVGSLLYTFSPVDTTMVQKELGAKAAGLGITQIVPIPAGVRLKVVSEYVQALKDLGRGEPSFYGLEAYIEAKVLVEGLRRAGPSPNAASLIKGLETLRSYDAGDFQVSYAPGDHAGANFVEIDVIDASGIVRR